MQSLSEEQKRLRRHLRDATASVRKVLEQRGNTQTANVLAQCSHHRKRGERCKSAYCLKYLEHRAYLRARRTQAQLQLLTEAEGAELYFLTLTAKNIALDELSRALKDFEAWYKRFIAEHPAFREWREPEQELPRRGRPRSAKRRLLGWSATIETAERPNGSLWPHLHAVLVLRPGFPFTGRSRISQRSWADAWRAIAGPDAGAEITRLDGGSEAGARYLHKPGDLFLKPFRVNGRLAGGDRLLMHLRARHGKTLRFDGGLLGPHAWERYLYCSDEPIDGFPPGWDSEERERKAKLAPSRLADEQARTLNGVLKIRYLEE